MYVFKPMMIIYVIYYHSLVKLIEWYGGGGEREREKAMQYKYMVHTKV